VRAWRQNLKMLSQVVASEIQGQDIRRPAVHFLRSVGRRVQIPLNISWSKDSLGCFRSTAFNLVSFGLCQGLCQIPKRNWLSCEFCTNRKSNLGLPITFNSQEHLRNELPESNA